MVSSWLKCSVRLLNHCFVHLNHLGNASTPTTTTWTTRINRTRRPMSTSKRPSPSLVRRGTSCMLKTSTDTFHSFTPMATSASARSTSWSKTSPSSTSTAASIRNIPTTKRKIDTWTSSHVSTRPVTHGGGAGLAHFRVNLSHLNPSPDVLNSATHSFPFLPSVPF